MEEWEPRLYVNWGASPELWFEELEWELEWREFTVAVEWWMANPLWFSGSVSQCPPIRLPPSKYTGLGPSLYEVTIAYAENQSVIIAELKKRSVI